MTEGIGTTNAASSGGGAGWRIFVQPFEKAIYKFGRIAAELIADLACSMLILCSIKALEVASKYLWPDGLKFFEETGYITLHVETLFGAAHVVNIILFLVMSGRDCIKVYQE